MGIWAVNGVDGEGGKTKGVARDKGLPEPKRGKPTAVVLARPEEFNVSVTSCVLTMETFRGISCSEHFELCSLFDSVLVSARLADIVRGQGGTTLTSSVRFHEGKGPSRGIGGRVESP